MLIKPRLLLALLAGAALALPAQAEFSIHFGNLAQFQPQRDPRRRVDAPPSVPYKQWGPVEPVPTELQAAADRFAAASPDVELRPLLARLYIEGERNATLNFERIGLAALARGEFDLAAKSFDEAVFRIEQIYADNPEAQKAKSLWSAEKVKDFKGEPYERAMAYFYRGLLYAARGDFQNARAMFKQADYQDTVAEQEQFNGDFSLMPYLAGWASYCDGDSKLAQDYLQQAIKGDARYAQIPVERPLLVLFETGRAPFKYAGGKHGEALKWYPRRGADEQPQQVCRGPGASNCLPGTPVTAADIGFQATTRGGRPIDAILDGKASFKEGAETVSAVAAVVGNMGMQMAASSGDENSAKVGLLGLVASLVAQGVAQATQTQADIREWEQLSDRVWLETGTERLGAPRLSVALAAAGRSRALPASRLVDTPRCQLYWGRAEPPLSTLAEAGPLEPGDHPRDPAFRAHLVTDFLGQAQQPPAPQ